VQCGAACCRYIATQIDEPTCKRDYDNVRWYLLHRGVYVFADHEGDWYLEFEAPCDWLLDGNLCGNYGRRPVVCREHGDDGADCESRAATDPYEVRFSTPEEFETYLERRGIDWRWKRIRA